MLEKQHITYDPPSAFLRSAPITNEMDEIVDIVEIVRRIGRQQGQNAYYRTCYALLKKSQDLILETSNEPLHLYQSNAFEEPESVSTIADDLRNDIHALIARERRARSHWDEFFESNK
ncbi:hypothetical protein BDV12DRAFT_204974 [Aspergillus spectabilis]